MKDNFTEKDIQSMLRYLKYHEPENANRSFAVEMLRALQVLAQDLANKDLSQAELIAKALRAKRSESESS